MASQFPDGLSKAGWQYINYISLSSATGIIQRAKEIEFEYIRRLYFPHKPSRFQSFFAVETLDDVRLWEKAFALDDHAVPYAVWEILIENDDMVFRGDASWRDRMRGSGQEAVYSAWENHLDGKRYWSGEVSENPRPELVVPLKDCAVRVVKMVSIK